MAHSADSSRDSSGERGLKLPGTVSRSAPVGAEGLGSGPSLKNSFVEGPRVVSLVFGNNTWLNPSLVISSSQQRKQRLAEVTSFARVPWPVLH